MSQILGLRDAIVATIKTLAPKLDVEPHLGRFDEGEMRVFLTKAPAVRVAVLGLQDVAPDAAEDTVNPCVRIGLYVVTKDVARAADRTGAALSLVEALVLLCDRNRWGLGSYARPGRVAGAELLYSQGIRDAGVALWAIDLRQPIQLTSLAGDEGQLVTVFAGLAPDIGAGHQADYAPLGEVAHV
jgi:hypothetical protein